MGLVDIPNERKVHEGEIPLVGGIAILVAVASAHLIAGAVLPGIVLAPPQLAFYFGAALLVIVGMIDDYRELLPSTRIIVQFFVVLIMIYGGGLVVRNIGAMPLSGGELTLGVLAVPFTIVASIGVINAVNMSDGLDGLAGSLTLVSLLGFLVATLALGHGEQVELLVLLIAAVVAFLIFNVTVPGKRRALIFLGDAGSMLLGFALVWFAISLSQGPDRAIRPSSALWFLMVPVLDAVCMMGRRVARRRPIFSADKEHLHHVFLLAGFTVNETVLTMTALAAAGVLVGFGGAYYEISDWVMIGAFTICGLLYYTMIMHAWSVMRFLHRSICRRRNIGDRRSHEDRRRIRVSGFSDIDKRSGKDRRNSQHGRRKAGRKRPGS
jgi:UDP-GlcNAc:undecaprenyl-phosphate GlcNAc-1-phosphate transferase